MNSCDAVSSLLTDLYLLGQPFVKPDRNI
jgi:hypothetical protein